MQGQKEETLSQRFYHKTQKKFIPLNGIFEITYKCNLSCGHCYICKDAAKEELALDDICAILDKLAEAGCFFLVLTGGEILCRDDFFEIAAYCKKKNFCTRLFTNATLIDADKADKIASLNPQYVETSLYGTEQGMHEYVTNVPGSFERTIKGIRLLRERKVNVIIKSILMRHNAMNLKGMEDFARELGVGLRGIQAYLYPRDDGSLTPLDYKATCEQIMQRLDYSEDRDDVRKKMEFYNPEGDDSICLTARNTIAIDPYGNASPCIMIRDGKMNIRNFSFPTVWNSPTFIRYRSLNSIDLKECGDCKYNSICRYFRCQGAALLEKQDALKPYSEVCRYAQCLYNWTTKEA